MRKRRKLPPLTPEMYRECVAKGEREMRALLAEPGAASACRRWLARERIDSVLYHWHMAFRHPTVRASANRILRPVFRRDPTDDELLEVLVELAAPGGPGVLDAESGEDASLDGLFFTGDDGVYRLAPRGLRRAAERVLGKSKGPATSSLQDWDSASAPLIIGAAPSADPVEAVLHAEAAGELRDLQDDADRRGPAYAAALRYRLGALTGKSPSRREVAEDFGVSPKALQHREPWADDRIRALRQRTA